MISVVIPAHNEEAVLGRCLSTMLAGADPGELDVIVVCNGCSDRTAEIAREFGDAVRVVETSIPSKANALNMGDRLAWGYPRVYLDGDVVLSIDALRSIAEVLLSGRALAAAPQMRVKLDHANSLVRAYYAIWTRLPYVTNNKIGGGIYALSEVGRRRFEEFPQIIGDDLYVQLLFRDEERLAVPGIWFDMTPPSTLRSLINIEIRRYAGTVEVRERFGERMSTDHGHQRKTLMACFSDPKLWLSLAIYIYVKIATRAGYASRKRRQAHKQWSRDESSREGSVGP